MVDPVAAEPLTMVVLMVVTVNVLIVLEKDKEVPLVNLEKAQEHYTQEAVAVTVTVPVPATYRTVPSSTVSTLVLEDFQVTPSLPSVG